jgi:hypothetical protein
MTIVETMSTAITTRAASLAEGTGGWQRHVSLLTRRWREMDSNSGSAFHAGAA